MLFIDNFLDDPVTERNKALRQKYEAIKHNGLNYRGISLTEDAQSVQKIEFFLSEKFENTTVMYRRYLRGEQNETYIHCDVDIGTITGILFLTLPGKCSGGTALWKHKKYGWDSNPTEKQLEEQGLKPTKEFFHGIYLDGFHEKRWEKTDFIAMKFNRLILFDSARYHSRYPQEAFGTRLQDSRLIKVFFLKEGIGC